ncbi:MAG TPA: nickel insertion protein, partial [Terriglobales bacterium]|nr:nickel insertion protein [Terriglobales bacterium]
MRIAYLDCFSGISGDMFLGALLDAGVPAELLEKTVEALGVGARLEVSRVNRSGISAVKVDVYSHGEKDLPREEFEKSRSRESKSGSRESGVGSQHGAQRHSHPLKNQHGHERET